MDRSGQGITIPARPLLNGETIVEALALRSSFAGAGPLSVG